MFSPFALPYAYWQEYLEFFDEVRPLARVGWAASADPSWTRADGPGVRFISLPEYRGFWEILRRLPQTWLIAGRALAHGDYFLIRGGNVSALLWSWLKLRRIPYAREVVGHEGEAVALVPDVQMFGLAGTLSRISEWLGRKESQGACCANYVARFLGARYPTRSGAPMFFFSDVQLRNGDLRGPRAAESFSAAPLKLVSVGRLNPEKGYAVLLDALHHLDAAGKRDWHLDIIGPGPQLETLRTRAAQYEQGDRVTFHGMVKRGPEVFSKLDSADLFVLPSLGGEGMPRAAIEALARGLPGIATRTGGMPDLLDEACLARPGDALEFAELIRGYLGNRERLAAESQRSFQRAMQFHPDELRRQKHAFWSCLRDHTDRWRRSMRKSPFMRPRQAACA
ncbi:MAG TPA: glycosyltransferase [Phycisphaerae bacterium]